MYNILPGTISNAPAMRLKQALWRQPAPSRVLRNCSIARPNPRICSSPRRGRIFGFPRHTDDRPRLGFCRCERSRTSLARMRRGFGGFLLPYYQERRDVDSLPGGEHSRLVLIVLDTADSLWIPSFISYVLCTLQKA